MGDVCMSGHLQEFRINAKKMFVHILLILRYSHGFSLARSLSAVSYKVQKIIMYIFTNFF